MNSELRCADCERRRSLSVLTFEMAELNGQLTHAVVCFDCLRDRVWLAVLMARLRPREAA